MEEPQHNAISHSRLWNTLDSMGQHCIAQVFPVEILGAVLTHHPFDLIVLHKMRLLPCELYLR
jgi:hypothetical protein